MERMLGVFVRGTHQNKMVDRKSIAYSELLPLRMRNMQTLNACMWDSMVQGENYRWG